LVWGPGWRSVLLAVPIGVGSGPDDYKRVGQNVAAWLPAGCKVNGVN
jgi:hypothetical protein